MFLSLLPSAVALERQLQRHLHLPRTPNRLIHHSQPLWTIIKSNVRSVIGIRIARDRRKRGRSLKGESIEVFVLRHVINRQVEARRIRYVKNFEAVFQVEAVTELRIFYKRYVQPPLPGLHEDIALSGRKGRFVWIIGGDCSVQRSRRQQRNREALRPQRRLGPRANRAGYRGLRRAPVPQWHDRIRNAVRNTVKNAPHRSTVIDHAERLAALVNSQSLNLPAIRDFALP